ncbi:MAG: metallophosphoesterase [Desulfococcaceae bacterium]
MKIAILSDIHGNLEALEQVLADADRSEVSHIISLGDNIGYGPDPERVMQILRTRKIPSVMGNHEISVQSERFSLWFNPVIRRYIQQTLEGLSPESIRMIQEMPRFLCRWNAYFVHGFPPKSPFLYLFQMNAAKVIRAFGKINERICFVGHTHELNLVEYDGISVSYSIPGLGSIQLNRNSRYIINAGSVGQPRDGDDRAKYVIWDCRADSLEVKYIPYDIDAVIRRIIDAGYPEYFGTRLRQNS